MCRLALTITATGTILCCAALAWSFKADAMSSGAPGGLRLAIDAGNPIERAACGWYPRWYPQSWAVYNRGLGCVDVYNPFYYGPYFYRPHYYRRYYYRPYLSPGWE